MKNLWHLIIKDELVNSFCERLENLGIRSTDWDDSNIYIIHAKQYFDLTAKFKTRKKDPTAIYYEHHILPESLFPEYAKDPDNLVLVTRYEHMSELHPLFASALPEGSIERKRALIPCHIARRIDRKKGYEYLSEKELNNLDLERRNVISDNMKGDGNPMSGQICFAIVNDERNEKYTICHNVCDKQYFESSEFCEILPTGWRKEKSQIQGYGKSKTLHYGRYKTKRNVEMILPEDIRTLDNNIKERIKQMNETQNTHDSIVDDRITAMFRGLRQGSLDKVLEHPERIDDIANYEAKVQMLTMSKPQSMDLNSANLGNSSGTVRKAAAKNKNPGTEAENFTMSRFKNGLKIYFKNCPKDLKQCVDKINAIKSTSELGKSLNNSFCSGAISRWYKRKLKELKSNTISNGTSDAKVADTEDAEISKLLLEEIVTTDNFNKGKIKTKKILESIVGGPGIEAFKKHFESLKVVDNNTTSQ